MIDFNLKDVSASAYSRIFGLTGAIASGKSAASDILKSFGAYIADCDLISRSLTVPGSLILDNIVSEFGESILDESGNLNRKKLGSIVFNDEDALIRLNALMHTAIWKETFRQAAAAAAEGNIVFISAPLLFEHGAEAAVNKVWVIDVNEEIQLKRLMKRDSLSRKDALNRIRAQMSVAEKAARADVLIDNNGTLSDLRKNLEFVWQEKIADVCSR